MNAACRCAPIEHGRAVGLRHRRRIELGTLPAERIELVQVAYLVAVALQRVVQAAPVHAPVRRLHRLPDPVRIGHDGFQVERGRRGRRGGQRGCDGQGDQTRKQQLAHGYVSEAKNQHSRAWRRCVAGCAISQGSTRQVGLGSAPRQSPMTSSWRLRQDAQSRILRRHHRGRSTMKSMRWLLVLLLAWTLPAWADDTRQQTFVVGADVNAQGEVTQTQVDANVAKPIAAVLDLALKKWSFLPVQRDGKSLPAHTFIEVKFEAITDAAGKYTLTIRYVSQGPKWDKKFMPRYPPDAVRERAEGSVAIIGELQPDGKLTITDSRTSVGGRAGKLLVQAAKDSLLLDAYIPEQVDGMPVPARLRVVIHFNLNRVGAAFPERSRRRFTLKGYCGAAKQGSSDRGLFENMNDADRSFMEKTGFDVGAEVDRSWHSGISSVLQPRVINTVTMHL